MRLLLIRHGETVDNVAGIYAGITDSALTNHGVLQTQRLGSHLAATDVKVSHIFSSDLQRAFNTAEAVRSAQSPAPPETTRLEILREQDFGFYEGKQFFERPRHSNKTGKEAHQDVHRNEPGFQDVEPKHAMAARMDIFVEAHLLPLFGEVEAEKTVVVVAHGIILSYLWRAILKRFHTADVHVVPGAIVSDGDRSLEHLGGWSNTGYLDLDIRSKTAATPEVIDPRSSEDAKVVPVAVVSSSAGEKLPEAVAGAVSTEQPRVPTPSTATSGIGYSPPQSTLRGMSLVVKAVNSQAHLRGLKKTRGGIGSLKHDSTQKTVDSFFTKKQRTL